VRWSSRACALAVDTAKKATAESRMANVVGTSPRPTQRCTSTDKAAVPSKVKSVAVSAAYIAIGAATP
jgi:hypothetical protein